MDDFCILGKGVDAAGDPVVEAGAHGQHHIRVGDRHVCPICAVHPEHAQTQFMLTREPAEAHQGHGHRDPKTFRQPFQFGCGVGENDAPTRVEQRALCLEHEIHGPFDLAGVPRCGGVVAREIHLLDGFIFNNRGCDVLGDIHQNGTRSSRACDVKGLPDDPTQVAQGLHQVVVLGAGAGDSQDVGLLKGVVADEHGGNLTAEDHQGDGIHVSGGKAGYRVRGPRARGDQADPHLSGGPCVSVRCVYGTLFVAHQVVADVGAVERIVQVEDSPPGKTEQGVHLFPFQGI